MDRGQIASFVAEAIILMILLIRALRLFWFLLGGGSCTGRGIFLQAI